MLRTPDHVQTSVHAVSAPTVSVSRQVGHFVRHYVEMCVPMCIGFAVGDLVYFGTCNAKTMHKYVPFPNARSLIALDKKTGRLVAVDNADIGKGIFHGSWSSPSLATVNGRPLIFYGGGDGVCYAFDPKPVPNAELSEMDYLLGVDDMSRIGAIRLLDPDTQAFLRVIEDGARGTPPLLELAHLIGELRFEPRRALRVRAASMREQKIEPRLQRRRFAAAACQSKPSVRARRSAMVGREQPWAQRADREVWP